MATSERMNVDAYSKNLNDYIIYLTHMATYEFAEKYCKNKIVLDFGCGTGYGSYYISKVAKKVIAVDISQEAIDLCKKNYKNENLTFKLIDDLSYKDLKIENETFDVVLSFQVIEHIYDRTKYVSEIKRILKKNGKFICATPDKSLRLLPFQNPWNRWHVYEYGHKEFKLQLDDFFKKTAIFGMSGSRALMDIELARYKKNRLVLFLFSLKIYPYFIRFFLLNLVNNLNNYLLIFKIKNKNIPDEYFLSKKFKLSNVYIKPYKDIKKSLNLIALCEK